MNKKILICLLSGQLAGAAPPPVSLNETALFGEDHTVRSKSDCEWAYEQLEVRRAWNLLAERGLQQPGQNVRVAHLDTGIIPIRSIINTHTMSQGQSGIQVPPLSVTPDIVNFVRPQNGPWDDNPKSPSFGHGTATASLLIGWMNDTGISGLRFRGLAPWTQLLPIKVTDSVVMVGNSQTGGTADLRNLSSGIQLAAQIGADVITVSLGALFDGDGLINTAVKSATESGAIVIAAAGQTFPVNLVPLPARLPDVIAVTASTKNRTAWNEGFVGRTIAWAAPGDDICLLKARMHDAAAPAGLNKDTSVSLKSRSGEILKFTDSLIRSSGTSYATAYTAAAAVLWLQYHSPARLRQRYGQKNINALFKAVAKRFAMEIPEGWLQNRHGKGILNIRKLIEAPLPCTESDSPAECDVKTSHFLNLASD